MPKSKKRTIEIGGKAALKPTAHQLIWYKRQERKVRDARHLARRVIWYFGYDPIRSALDCEIGLRDVALALLGQPMVGGGQIPTNSWKKIFRNAAHPGPISYSLGGKKLNIPWGEQ